ncbi:MAG: PRC-barrel domain-containing protein [Pseudomonadota bacterium]|nr:PRC-barrel domain-containing protein [Pseudomonadota bacterium]
MEQTISWVATAATIVAACMTASNLGSRITGYGFAVFLVGSIAWLTHGLISGQPALVWTNIVLTFLNLFGIWRWLGRQATIESGAHAAADASRETAGPTLFSVSLLASAPLVTREGRPIGSCVDAMADCGTGRIRYLVVSEGGLAGVGETLRRLPWGDADVDDGAVRAALDSKGFRELEEIPRDQWPAR